MVTTKNRKMILVVSQDLTDAREKTRMIYEIIKKKGYNISVLPEIISNETTIARCRNLEPLAVFISRAVIFKNGFINFAQEIKTNTTARVFLFDSDDELHKIVCEEF